jgi:hypothetical protein
MKLPVHILNKLRSIEEEIRQILDEYDCNRTYFLQGTPKDVSTLAKMLSKKDIPNEVVNDHVISFEPEVYSKVMSLVERGKELGKINGFVLTQDEEVIFNESMVEEGTNVYEDLYNFLVGFKPGKGYKEERNSIIAKLDEIYEDNGFTKKLKTIRGLLHELAEVSVIKGADLETLQIHYETCGI